MNAQNPFVPVDPQAFVKENIANYLIFLGNAHRDLWIRRLKKGMKPKLQAEFDALVAEHTAYLASLPKVLPNRPGLSSNETSG